MAHILAVIFILFFCIEFPISPASHEIIERLVAIILWELIKLLDLLYDIVNFTHVVNDCDFATRNVFYEVLSVVTFGLLSYQYRVVAGLSQSTVLT